MKTRILLAALVLGAAACSADSPTASGKASTEIRARHNGGYFGGGHRSDADSTKVHDGGYTGTAAPTEPVNDAGGGIGL